MRPTAPRFWTSPSSGFGEVLEVANHLGSDNIPDAGELARRVGNRRDSPEFHTAECCGRLFTVPVANPCPACADAKRRLGQ